VTKLYRVKLLAEERAQLEGLLSNGKAAARTLMHARILLKADECVAGPRLSDDQIAEAVEVMPSGEFVYHMEACRHSADWERWFAALRTTLARVVHGARSVGAPGPSSSNGSHAMNARRRARGLPVAGWRCISPAQDGSLKRGHPAAGWGGREHPWE
jgi:hypothetical protein